MNIIASFFASYGNIEDIPSDLRYQFTNIIKMSIYLFVEFVLSFNKKIETDYKILLLETKVSTYFFFIFSVIKYNIILYKIKKFN